MNFGLMLGGVILVFIVVLVIVHKTHKRENDRIRDLYLEKAEFYNELWKDNEILRSYMDNKHLIWSDVTRETINKKPLDPDLVVLIRGQDLHDLTQTQWRDGYDMAAVSTGKAMQMRYGVDNQVDENEETVVKMRASFADKRFDNDFAKFVNALTSIAVHYGHTQQVRDRISRQVIDFRMYLSKKQRGERVNFPKT